MARPPQRNVVRLSGALPRADLRAPRRRWPWRRYGTWLLVGAIVAGFVYLIFFSPVVRITQLTVAGNTATPTDAIVTQVQQSLNSSWWGHNILFVSTTDVQRQLIQSDLQIKTAQVTRHWLHGLHISVTERQSALLWQSNNLLYVLDNDGRVIEQVNGQKPNGLPVIRDSANLPVKTGDAVAPPQFIEFCRQILQLLPANKIVAKDFSIPATTGELDVQVAAGYVIKFDTSRPATDQMNDLTAVLSTLAKQNKRPQQYIDLRVPHRVFYL